MKSFKVSFLFILFFTLQLPVFAQDKTATFKVWGNCGMCKKTIEKAAKEQGASSAEWNVNSKMLLVTYNPSTTSEDKILKGVADAGYDNEQFKATDEVYNKLHYCCQYDRKDGTAGAHSNKTCCMKDGKCSKKMSCCKKVEGKSDCCSKNSCSEKGGCCDNCSEMHGKSASGKHHGDAASCNTHETCDKNSKSAKHSCSKSCCKSE